MKNFVTKLQKLELVFLIAVLLIMDVTAFGVTVRLGITLTVLSAVAVPLFYLAMIRPRQQQEKNVFEVLKSIKNRQQPIVIGDDIPTVLMDENQMVVWYNHAFAAAAKTYPKGANVYQLFPDLARPDKDKRITIDGVSYRKDLTALTYQKNTFVLLRLIDKQNEQGIKRVYMGHLGAVCYVQIDNLEEVKTEITQAEQSSVLAAVDKRINDFANHLNGVCRQFEKDKYLIIFERRHLPTALKSRFSILQEVRNYKTGGPSVTLSIAVGVADTLSQSNEFAVKALELAQSRGGDQAVVKQYENYHFFGGLQKGVEKRSRVKMREFAKGLRNLMEQVDDIFIMGHSVPDLDSFGSSLGLLSCARHVNKKAYIVLDKPNTAIGALMSAIKGYREYDGVIIGSQEAEMMMKPTSMLIIVDTQIQSYLEAPNLLHKTDVVVIIDHHFRGTVYIDNPALLCHEPYASSACELVTETIQYFAEKVEMLPLEAEALLAGITIDTKGFSFKTGVRTFEAASYLRGIGADTISIRQLFQDDLETFSRRAEVVQKAKILKPGIAVSRVPPDTENASLIAAQAADSLLTIRGVMASFVISYADSTSVISGRSLGGINAQLVLEKLGGGGHPTIAGARIKNTNMDIAYDKLMKAIGEYLKEEDKDK